MSTPNGNNGTATALNLELVRQNLTAMGIELIPVNTRGQYTTSSIRCPVPSHGKGRGDINPSATIREGKGGRAYYECYANCSEEQFAESLGTTLEELRYQAKRAPGQGGCTIADLARAKKLPIDHLKKWGLRDSGFRGERWVNIPYYDEAGNEVSMQRRLALEKGEDGDARFKFKSGSKVVPYGLNFLHHARKKGCLTLVEGTSDCWTLWEHGFPALGIPSAKHWKNEWVNYLRGVKTVYLMVEPDKAGEGLLKKVGLSKLRDRLRVVRLPAKDPSALHLEDPDAFKAAWTEALAGAKAYSEELDEERKVRLADALKRCGGLLAERDILTRFTDDLGRAGVVGEERVAKLLYLGLTSRLLDRPVNMAVKGVSSAGKSYLIQKVIDHFPASAHYDLTAMSERALAYSEEPLEHRFIVVYEFAGVQGETRSYLVRSLLSEGKLRYETVEKTRDGFRPRTIERDGPSGLILSTTAVRVDRELETRLISVTVSDTREQTRAVMLQLASDPQPVPDLDRWHALQEALECSTHRVTIPFAKTLAELIHPEAVRLRRDFGAVLGLIASHAILHQAGRGTDRSGAILATTEDYRAVHELVADLVAEGVEATVSESVRETVQAVRELSGEKKEHVAIKALAGRLKLDRTATYRRARSALEGGWLVNEAEERKPMRLLPGAPLPDDIDILPRPFALEDAIRCAEAPEDAR